jgi:pilus assembly protein Flp/PilA
MMCRLLRRLYREEAGATAVEYGLIAGLISVVLIAALEVVNSELTNVFNYISTNLSQALL